MIRFIPPVAVLVILLTSSVAQAQSPGAPTNLRANIVGSTVTLMWIGPGVHPFPT
jgi:hypothetical protein